MSHTRSIDNSARIIDQCARGRFIRNVNTVTYVIATTRSGNVADSRKMADLITNESGAFKALLVAPSDGKVETITARGTLWPVMASGGYVLATVFKEGKPMITGSGYVIGGHDISGFQNALSGHFTALTSGTAYDLTLNTASGYEVTFTEGQAIYTMLSMSNTTLKSGTAPSMVAISMEWVPQDKSYASS